MRFNIPDEFLAELVEKDQALVHRGIVRITHLYRDSTLSPVIRHLSIVATTCIGDDVIRCECYCGDLWQMEDNDKRVTAKAAQIRRELEEGCARLALHVRAGMVEARAEQDTANS
ncbi:MAG TPA: hypothetical protein VGX03_14410 [Candidatus Binatia bacterium]|nr:hypothetical protein [Candidatus Binatia bacterium]